MVGIHAAYTPVYVAHVEWYLMTSSVKNVEKRRIFILKENTLLLLMLLISKKISFLTLSWTVFM